MLLLGFLRLLTCPRYLALLFFSGIESLVRDFITDYTNARVPHLLRICRPAKRVYYSSHRVSQVSCITLIAPDRAVARPEKIGAGICAALGPHADITPPRQDKAVGKVVGVAAKVFERPAGHILADGSLVFDPDVFAIQI